MSKLVSAIRIASIVTVCLYGLCAGTFAREAPQNRARVDAEIIIDVKSGTTTLNQKVGDIDFIAAYIEVGRPSNDVVKIKLKVDGSNFSKDDHDAEVKAALVGKADEVIASQTKKREIEEGEKNKGLNFEFRASTEQLAAGLRFKLTLSYIP